MNGDEEGDGAAVAAAAADTLTSQHGACWPASMGVGGWWNGFLHYGPSLSLCPSSTSSPSVLYLLLPPPHSLLNCSVFSRLSYGDGCSPSLLRALFSSSYSKQSAAGCGGGGSSAMCSWSKLHIEALSLPLVQSCFKRAASCSRDMATAHWAARPSDRRLSLSLKGVLSCFSLLQQLNVWCCHLENMYLEEQEAF